MSVNSLLIPILNRIDFSNRFKSLSSQYDDFDNRFIGVDVSVPKEIIEQLGYKVKYDKTENFFKIVETLAAFKIQFNISLDRGVIEFIWGVERNGERLKMGGSICGAVEKLTGENFTRKPIFRNYEDLQEILKVAFKIYEDFKHELIKQNT